MPILDEQLRLRDGGSGPRVTATEAGLGSTTRDATTGQAVIDISKTGYAGVPIFVVTDLDTGTSNDKTVVCTIQASDLADFGSGVEVVATFPVVTHGDAGIAMVRRIHTQKKYIRSVLTLAGSNGTFSVDFKIFVGTGLMADLLWT